VQSFDPSKVPVKSDILNGCIICVLPADKGIEGNKEREEIQAEVPSERTDTGRGT
jgi:hypothetical protein